MSVSSTEPPRLRDIDWRWALPRIAVVFLITRLLVLAVAVAVETTQPPPPEGIRVDERPIVASVTAWDGRYYIGIAEEGYHADPDYGPDYAFFPGYPITARAMSLATGGDTTLGAIVASNVAFALALVVFYALSVRHLSQERAWRSQWFLVLAPGAIAFGLAYSDSLFLLLALCAFLAMELGRPWLSGIALALVVLTRVPGILLLLPLLLLLTERHGWRPSRTWLPLLLAPAVFIGVYAYFWTVTGDPMAALEVQSFWRASETSAVAGAGEAVLDYATEHGNENMTLAPAPPWVVAYYIGSLAFSAFLLVFFRHDRVPPAYTLVAILGIATVFASGTLQSGPRYLAVAWPFAWVLASRQSRIGRGVVLAVFAVAQVALLWLAFDWRLAP